MAATIIELLKVAGVLYLIGCILLGIIIYLLIIIRLADYYLHPEAYEEDHEL